MPTSQGIISFPERSKTSSNIIQGGGGGGGGALVRHCGCGGGGGLWHNASLGGAKGSRDSGMHICGCRFIFVHEIVTYLYVRMMKVEEVALDVLLIVCSDLSTIDLLNLRLTSVFFKKLVDCTPKLGFMLRLFINGGEADDAFMELSGEFHYRFFSNEDELKYLDSFWLRHLATVAVITDEEYDDPVARNDRFERLMRFLESRRTKIYRIKVILSLNYQWVTKFDSQQFFRRVNESPLDLILEVHDISEDVCLPFELLSETPFTLFFNLELRSIEVLESPLLYGSEYPLLGGALESPSFYFSFPQKVIKIDTNHGVLQGRELMKILGEWGPSELIKFSPSWLDFSDIPDWDPASFGPVVFEDSKAWPEVSNPTFKILSKLIFQEGDALEISNLSEEIKLDNNQSLLRLDGLNIADILKLTVNFGCSFITIDGFTVSTDSLGWVQVPFRIPNCVVQNTGNGRLLLPEILKVLASSGVGGELKLQGNTSQSITITGKYTFELRGWYLTTVVKGVCEGEQFTQLQLYDLHLDSYVVRDLETLSFRLHRCTFQNMGNSRLPLSEVLKFLSFSSRGTKLELRSYSDKVYGLSVTVAGEYDFVLSGWYDDVACITELCKKAYFPITSLKLLGSWCLDNYALLQLVRSRKSVVIESGFVMNAPKTISFVKMAPILLGFYRKTEDLAVSISDGEARIDDGRLRLRGWHGAEIAEVIPCRQQKSSKIVQDGPNDHPHKFGQ
jgi:hypothetical protein